MVKITVSDELARAIVEAGAGVTLVDSTGKAIARLTSLMNAEGPIGMTDEHIAELQRIMAEDDGTRYSWAEVKEHLRYLAQE